MVLKTQQRECITSSSSGITSCFLCFPQEWTNSEPAVSLLGAGGVYTYKKHCLSLSVAHLCPQCWSCVALTLCYTHSNHTRCSRVITVCTSGTPKLCNPWQVFMALRAHSSHMTSCRCVQPPHLAHLLNKYPWEMSVIADCTRQESNNVLLMH